MLLKTLIASLLLLVLAMLAMGIKLLFNPKGKFTYHSCSMKDGCFDNEDTCPSCGTKDIPDPTQDQPS